MYDPVIYYNLYLLEKTYNINQAEKYLRLSYTKDFSLYRIQDEYRNSLKELHEEFNTNYLDLNNILIKNDFIDYCHPKEDAHAKIAKNIIKLINKNYKISKDSPKKIYVNKLVSPDYFNDSSKNFIDYYLIEKNIDKNKIKNHLLYLLKNYNFYNFSGFELITKYSNDKNRCYLIHFIKTNFIHPIFTETLLSKETYLPLQSEIFSLPENFIYRVMFNYFIFFEKNISDKIIPKINLYLNSKLYEKIILRNNNFPLDLPLLLDKNYQKEIEKKMCLYISNQNILFENNICNRIKTTVFWYTRESFRYGTLSRNSMLYSRLSIDRLLETLIVLITIEFDNNAQKVELYTRMLLSLLSLIDIHESHVNKYLIQKNFDRTKYDIELSENKKNFLLLLEKLK